MGNLLQVGRYGRSADALKGADGGRDYLFSPCNLGYCDPRKGDSARSIKLRFTFTLPDGTKKTVAIDKAFPQPEIIESMAGDNTYYQWGRKDPMLPGIYNPQVVAEAGEDTHYNMINKPYYKGAYEFCPGVSGVTLGDGIRNPYTFFMHGHTGSEMYGETQFLRRHWHDGTNAPYAIRTIINYWNAQLCHTGQSSGQQLTLEAFGKGFCAVARRSGQRCRCRQEHLRSMPCGLSCPRRRMPSLSLRSMLAST